MFIYGNTYYQKFFCSKQKLSSQPASQGSAFAPASQNWKLNFFSELQQERIFAFMDIKYIAK